MKQKKAMIKLIYFASIFIIFYIYVGYPITVAFLGLLFKKNVKKGEYEPYVTFLIAAYNEEDYIEQTLLNKLILDYPQEKIQIIVISDESSDKTDEIVKKYKKRNVKLIRQVPRAGKTSGLNLAVPEAKGEILVFSDANSIYAPDALKKLVENFNDQNVGYVTGKMVYVNPDGSIIGDGCSAYMKYENYLRAKETQLGSIVGVDGGIDAMRKSIYSKLEPDQLPDFVQPLKVIEKGYRVVYEPGAVLKEETLNNFSDEYKMRVRVSLRSFWALKYMRQLLWGKGGPVFTWQLWVHKVLRYICFIFLILAFFLNAVLFNEGFIYKILFLLQSVAYIGAFTFPILEKIKCRIKLFYFCNYFLLINLAAAHGFFKFLAGKKQILWTPRKG